MKIATYLPVFKGFYGTYWDEPSFDGEAKHFKLPENFPFYDYINWSDYKNALAIKITSLIEGLLVEAGFVTGIEFEELVSPREYNFKNDSINCLIEPNIEAIQKFIEDNKQAFEKYLEEHLKSRSGFHSFHSHRIEDWIEDTNNFTQLDNKPLTLGFILDFICEQYDFDTEDIDMYLYENTLDIHAGQFYNEGFEIVLKKYQQTELFANYIDIDNLSIETVEAIIDHLKQVKEQVQSKYTLDLNVKETVFNEFKGVEVGMCCDELEWVCELEKFIEDTFTEISKDNLKLPLLNAV